MPKLNQVLAIEKGTKTRIHEFMTAAYHAFQKPQLFNGHSRVYTKRNEDGEELMPENVRVQNDAKTALAEIALQLTELIDITATKDIANCAAKADIEVDGKLLALQVPATFLLFLEKSLSDMKAEIVKLPELDPAQDWARDEQNQVWRAAPIFTLKTKKVPKVIVKYEATKEHPAQTEILAEDIPVGQWCQTLFSGAVSRQEKRALLDRITKLLDATKVAREKANETDAPRKAIGAELLKYVLGG